MTPRLRTALKKELERLRAELLAEGPARIEPNRRDAASVGVADEDAQALSEMLQTLASERNKNRQSRIGRIDRALRKIAEEPDEYGLCEECGEDIDEKRLRLVPEATWCAECQANADPRRGGARRSVTDYR
jgi:DnaK suppressor protein